VLTAAELEASFLVGSGQQQDNTPQLQGAAQPVAQPGGLPKLSKDKEWQLAFMDGGDAGINSRRPIFGAGRSASAVSSGSQQPPQSNALHCMTTVSELEANIHPSSAAAPSPPQQRQQQPPQQSPDMAAFNKLLGLMHMNVASNLAAQQQQQQHLQQQFQQQQQVSPYNITCIVKVSNRNWVLRREIADRAAATWIVR